MLYFVVVNSPIFQVRALIYRKTKRLVKNVYILSGRSLRSVVQDDSSLPALQ